MPNNIGRFPGKSRGPSLGGTSNGYMGPVPQRPSAKAGVPGSSGQRQRVVAAMAIFAVFRCSSRKFTAADPLSAAEILESWTATCGENSGAPRCFLRCSSLFLIFI
jgi:hypothetical protein